MFAKCDWWGQWREVSTVKSFNLCHSGYIVKTGTRAEAGDGWSLPAQSAVPVSSLVSNCCEDVP